MNYHFRNLVFEGGGVKGIAYAGALEVLEDMGILKDIKRVGGTSAGAMTALLLALNYSNDEIKTILWNTDFNKFLDGSWGVIRNMDRLLSEYGWYKGDSFKNWISEITKTKTGSSQTTFAELQAQQNHKELYLIGTNLSTGFAEILSHRHTPNMTLVEGVRISMSIPIFFTAVRNQKMNVCVDGGILENYPVKLFDQKSFIDQYYSRTGYYESINQKLPPDRSIDPYVFNMETLGFRLDSYKEIKIFEGLEQPKTIEINNFFNFIKRVVATMLDSQQNRHLHSDDWQRTIYIDTLGVRTTDFDIENEMKERLIQSGKSYTDRYFQWYENSKEALSNKPRQDSWI